MEVRGTLYILKDIREYGVKANEGYLSTLLPCHNEARERARQSDGAAYCRPAKKRRPTVAAQSDQL